MMFLLYLCWLAKGWQRENGDQFKECLFSLSAHDGQQIHECLGHFFLFVGFFKEECVCFFSPLW